MRQPLTRESVGAALRARYQPIYDNSFDDLIRKLNELPATKGLVDPE